MQVLTFKRLPVKLEILRTTKKYIVTRPVFSFGIGLTGKKEVKWDRETKHCIDSSSDESIRFKDIKEVSIPCKHTY